MAKRYILRSGGYAYRKHVQDGDDFGPGVSRQARPNAARTRRRKKRDLLDRLMDISDGCAAFFASLLEKLKGLFDRGEAPELAPESLYGEHGVQDKLFIPREHPKSFVLSVIVRTVGILCLCVMLAGFAGLGAGLGVAKGYIDTTPELDLVLIEDQAQTSLIYDKNGDLLTTFSDTENREWVDYEDIPDMLKNAFIAVEDVRFFEHNGVDYKRLASAVINTLLSRNTHGGSTITQQLIKNRVLSNEQSYRRKIQEAYLAFQLEKQYDKEQILEAYLNAIPLGGLNYGVKAAADDYFGKSLDQLSIRECALLAGLTQSPSRYHPRTNMYTYPDRWESRTAPRIETVLKAMYSAGFITKAQYDEAMADKVQIVEVSKAKQMYPMPAFIEYVTYNVVTHMLRAENLQDNKTNRSAMENRIRTGGYRIYTTGDPDMQTTVQEALSTYDNYPSMRDPSKAVKVEKNGDGTVTETLQPQAAAVVIESKTGQIRAMVGGRDAPERKNLFNRAYMSRVPVGSSIKPLSIYGPAIDLGAGTGTIEYNFAVPIDGYGGEKGYPGSVPSDQNAVTLREGVRLSLNIVAARSLYELVGLDTSVQYLTNLGVEPSAIKKDGPGLALGTSGVSPLEMAGAYAAIANSGTYLEPVAFTKVTDANGTVILDSETNRIKRQVFKPSTAYMLTSMLQTAVSAGTGKKAKIDGMTVAGKTGTNDDYRSVYFAGYTPYYTSALWIGHDDYSPQLARKSTGGTYAAPLWQSYMSKLHAGLEDKAIIADDPNSVGVVQRKVCSLSGLLATDACELDAKHKPVNEYYTMDAAPTKKCNMHVAVKMCKESGKLATDNCPKASVEDSFIEAVPASSPLYELPRDTASAALTHPMFGTDASRVKTLEYSSGTAKYFCDVHTSSQSSAAVELHYQTLLDMVNAFFANNGYSTPGGSLLFELTNELQNLLTQGASVSTLNSKAVEVQNAYQNAVANLSGH